MGSCQLETTMNMAQEILEHAKQEIIKHSENGITLAGVTQIMDRLIKEYDVREYYIPKSEEKTKDPQ